MGYIMVSDNPSSYVGQVICPHIDNNHIWGGWTLLEQRQYIKYVSTTLAVELYIMREGWQTKIGEIGGL